MEAVGGTTDSKGLELKPGPFPAHFQLFAHNPDGKKAHIKKNFFLEKGRPANTRGNKTRQSTTGDLLDLTQMQISLRTPRCSNIQSYRPPIKKIVFFIQPMLLQISPLKKIRRGVEEMFLFLLIASLILLLQRQQ